MNRRDFLLGIAGATVLLPVAVRAQQPRRIGLLSTVSAETRGPQLAAFFGGLAEAGYAEGRNLQVEYRWAKGDYSRLLELAAELVGRKVDVIFTSGGFLAALAAKEATGKIPIVFETGIDPVEKGLVASYARPGGNLTGVTILTADLMPKRLEVLSELVPQARAIALLVNPENASAERITRDVQQAALVKSVKLHVVKAASEEEFDPAFKALGQLHADALLVGNDPFFFSRRDRLVGLAARQRIPAIYEWRDFVLAGGLVSYGTSLGDMYRQAGAYVGRILAGAKPADLPVVQPTKFELAVNLKTAKALGLTIPPGILQRADEVIE